MKTDKTVVEHEQRLQAQFVNLLPFLADIFAYVIANVIAFLLPCEHSGHVINSNTARLVVNSVMSVTEQAEAQTAPKCHACH